MNYERFIVSPLSDGGMAEHNSRRHLEVYVTNSDRNWTSDEPLEKSVLQAELLIFSFSNFGDKDESIRLRA